MMRLSLVFHSGRKHERWDWLIEECTAKNIPILVDCAWFGTCFDIDVDLSHDCIKMVAFSTGKGLSGGNWRAGIVFSRLDEDRCGMRVQTEWNHGIHLNVALSNALMKKFSPDTMPNKYREAHRLIRYILHKHQIHQNGICFIVIVHIIVST